MEWLQISVSTTSECAELVSMIMYDAGSEGVLVMDDADVKELVEKKLNWDYVDEKLMRSLTGKAVVSGFFSVDFSAAEIERGLASLKENSVFPVGSLEVSSVKIDSADWENEWRKYYNPINLGKVVVVPAWQKAPDGAAYPVYIEPGMAFGTGNHETTSMCIELMQDLELKDKTVLDMGCGSGILGIAAAVLGAGAVVLSDIDPQAAEASAYNAELNKVSDKCKIILGDLNTDSCKADLVIANITADVLLRLRDQMNELLKPDGAVIISGIINSRGGEIESAYRKLFRIESKLCRGEWQAMLLRRI
ncbi:MAG: 50S ribosomal protein L11 methyltransferase [Christensenellales bacterium]